MITLIGCIKQFLLHVIAYIEGYIKRQFLWKSLYKIIYRNFKNLFFSSSIFFTVEKKKPSTTLKKLTKQRKFRKNLSKIINVHHHQQRRFLLKNNQLQRKKPFLLISKTGQRFNVKKTFKFCCKNTWEKFLPSQFTDSKFWH